jgi:hypothetical protein
MRGKREGNRKRAKKKNNNNKSSGAAHTRTPSSSAPRAWYSLSPLSLMSLAS